MSHTFFYSHTKSKYPKGCEHYVFSQFYPCTFEEDGVRYQFAEQYMMAKKAELFGDLATLSLIMESSDPKTIKALGRKVTPFDAGRWAQVSYEVVKHGNYLKFSQNPKLRDILLSTGDTLIVEASSTDKIWGIGLSTTKAKETPEEKWPGKNLLGKALTNVRDSLKKEGL